MQKLDRQVWAARETYVIGNLYRGVRVSTGALGDALSRALRPYREPEIEAPANFSAQLSSSGRSVATLYRGHQAVLRTGDFHRFVVGLLLHLGPVERLQGHLALRMGAVIHEGAAVLTPNRISILPHLLSSTLVDQGYQIVDAPLVNLDPSKMTVTVSGPNLDVDKGPLETWLGAPISNGPTGTFPVKGVLVESGGEAPSLLEVIAYLLARAAYVETEVVKADIDSLIAVLDRVPLIGVGDQRDLVAAVQSLWQ